MCIRDRYIGDTKYATVMEAVNAAAAINPSSEENRVYIDVMPGTYREQVVVKTPYVTIRKMPGTEGEAKLTWYYGLGSLYDSCKLDPLGLSDKQAAPQALLQLFYAGADGRLGYKQLLRRP